MIDSGKEFYVKSQISKMDSNSLHDLGRDLLISGLIPSLKCTFCEDVGFNNDKKTSHKGHPDTTLLHSEDTEKKIAVEFTVENNVRKYFKDVDECVELFKANKNFQYYVCVTNQNKEISQLIQNKTDFVSYTSEKLSIPKENVFYQGFSQLLLSFKNPSFEKVWSRSGYEVNDWYENIENYQKDTKSPPADVYQNIKEILNKILSTNSSSAIISYGDGVKQEDVVNSLIYVSDQVVLKDKSFPNLHGVKISKFASISDHNIEKRAQEILIGGKQEGGFLALHNNTHILEANVNSIHDFISRVSDSQSTIIILLSEVEKELILSKYPQFSKIVYPVNAVKAIEMHNKCSMKQYNSSVKRVMNKYRSRIVFITSIIYSLDVISLKNLEFWKKVCKLLNIKYGALKEIIDILIEEGVIINAGDLLMIHDKNLGRTLFEMTILEKDHDLNKIIEELQLYE